MKKLTIHGARTAHDLQHVNRMGVPRFGVMDLRLAASGKTSKCYLAPGAPNPPSAGTGGSDAFHFCPEHESIEIRYDIEDRFKVVDGAVLEFFTRFNDKPIWTIDLKPLGEDWWAHGKHAIKWDGRVMKATSAQAGTAGEAGMGHDFNAFPPDKTVDKALFPDGYVTLEHTPYKVRLTLKSATRAEFANPLYAWSYWQILVKGFELALGPIETVPAATVDDEAHKRNKIVHAKVLKDGGVPAPGSSRKVFLLSNLYKTNLAQMSTNAAFDVYQTLWGKGPELPVLAKIRLADSAGNAVKLETDKGAVALGRVKFLWDWTDTAEDVGAQVSPAKPKAFIVNAIKYYVDGTDSTRAASDHQYPKGDNCHVDRGGKRGPGADPVFPVQAGYDAKDALETGKFPFKVEPCTTRKWAAFTQAWSTGKLKGHTGVVLQPARMAGDNYTLTVYLAYDKKSKTELVLDAKDEPLRAADPLKKASGPFQIWRTIHLSRYIRKTAAMTAFFPGKAASVAKHYAMAYVELANKIDASNSYVMAEHKLADGTAVDYNKACREVLAATGHVFFTQNLATDAAADHKAESSMIRSRTYAEFVRRAHANLHTGVAAAANDFASQAVAFGITEPQFAERIGNSPDIATLSAASPAVSRVSATQTWLTTRKVTTPRAYCETLDGRFFGVGEPLASKLELVKGSKGGAKAPPGIVTMEFQYTHSFMRDQIAAGVGMRYWYGAAIDPTDADANRAVIMFWLAGVDEFSHEAGHHVYLPHANYPTARLPGGAQPNRHDDVDDGCLMSYSDTRPAFCGLCLLRMRGWSANALDKVSANNKKP